MTYSIANSIRPRLTLTAVLATILTAAPTPAEAAGGTVKGSLRRIFNRTEFRHLKPYKRKRSGRPGMYNGRDAGQRGGEDIFDPKGNPVIVRDEQKRGEILDDGDGRAILGQDEDWGIPVGSRGPLRAHSRATRCASPTSIRSSTGLPSSDSSIPSAPRCPTSTSTSA